MKQATYTYRIPPNPKLKAAELRAGCLPRISFIPELYNSHFLENFTYRCAYSRPIAMDIETSGLKIGNKDFRIRMIQVGNKDEAFCIPAVEDNIELVYDALLRGNCPIVTQGGVFDWVALMVEYGMAELDPARLWDTKVEAHHWDTRTMDKYTDAPGHGLYALQQLYVHPDVAEDIKKAPARRAKELGVTLEEYFATVELDDPEYVLYGGMDVVTTSFIHQELSHRLAASKVHDSGLMRNDMEDFRNCIWMGARGLKVDEPYFNGLYGQYIETHDKCLNEAKEEYGVTALGSTKQLAEKFTDDGYPPQDVTDKGNPSVKEAELLRQVERGSRLAEIVLEGKRAKKWANTFVKGVLEASSKHGKIHPKLDPLGARTARYSSSEPNMQNLPGQVDDIRMGFVVDDPDTEVVVSIDYQSQELRLLAALSGDPSLLADLEAGKKPAKILAKRIYGDNYTKQQYTKTKNTLYGMIYGGGAKTLSEQAGIPIEDTKKVMKAFFDMYPGVKTYFDSLISEASSKGYIVNPAGRPIIVDPSRLYSALNYMMQSLGRELIAGAVRDIMKSKWKEAVRVLVHDEIVLVAPTEYIDELVRDISEMMDTEINGVHFPVGAEVCGTRWKGHES